MNIGFNRKGSKDSQLKYRTRAVRAPDKLPADWGASRKAK
jgi:hypothetical protein